jgi:ribosomal-protein-alanine N-acetyltransferase
VSLCDATPAYADVLAALHAAAFPPGARWGRDAMELQLGLAGAFGLIADGAGFVLVRRVLDEAEVLTLAVHPDAQRGGVGRGLMWAAMCRAAAEGARTMFLEVAAGNMAARALYTGLGFTQVGLRRRYYADGADALVLRAPLIPCAATGK